MVSHPRGQSFNPVSSTTWTVLFWTEFSELFVLGSAGAAHLLHSIDSLVNDLTEWVQTDPEQQLGHSISLVDPTLDGDLCYMLEVDLYCCTH